MQILDGKGTARIYKEKIKNEVEKLHSENKKIPHLAAVIVGDDPASHTYVNHKIKACQQVGFKSTRLHYDSDITEEQLLQKINELNHDDEIDGFIVQVPLPPQIDKRNVIQAINFLKDVDGFHPINIGRMAKNIDTFLPATPLGILKLIAHYDIPTKGRHCVVVGRSEIVGSPVSILMAREGYPGEATVTLTHKYTVDLGYYTRQAEILITAVGKPALIREDMVKNEAVVIDVGITRVKDETKKKGFALKGDVDFDQVAPKTQYITPVPGGVGPMTIIGLLENTLMAAKKELYG